MACEYLARELVVDRPCRFDVVTVMLDGPAPVIEVYENAFDARCVSGRWPGPLAERKARGRPARLAWASGAVVP